MGFFALGDLGPLSSGMADGGQADQDQSKCRDTVPLPVNPGEGGEGRSGRSS